MESFICLEEIDQIYSLNIVTQNLETQASVDKNLLQDQRVLENMLSSEEEHRVLDYCGTGVQREVAPHMRKIVTDWMLEVCEDQQCQPQVFFLAVSYLDRFLSSLSITKTQFQLLASVCILLASKFSQVVPITTEQLVIYTDNSVTVEELKEWELFVLEILGWELYAATAHDFLDHLGKCDTDTRRQAETIAAMAVTEYKFVSTKQSVIAAASLAAAVQRDLEKEDVIQTLSELVRSSPSEITFFMHHLPLLPAQCVASYDSDAESGYSSGPEPESAKTEFVKINEPTNDSSCYSTPKDSYLVSQEVC